MTVKNRLDGRGRQKCQFCGYKSISGMLRSKGFCPYHWAKTQWGKKHADRCHPTHPEAQGGQKGE